MKSIFMLIALFLCLFNAVANITGEIKGQVVDENDLPLPGVTVVLKNTSFGTVTNTDGFFNLNINEPNAVLVFTFVGYKKQEVNVTSREINIKMVEDAQLLDELIVVGYGVQRKGSVTGSVAQVNTEEIMQSPVGAISNMVAGKLPGLVFKQSSGEPGNDEASINIRGASTFGSSNSPVVVVDGIRRSFDQLDPEEIESITILKDASAAAVYELQAASRVILVTTKKGSIGKPRIKLSSSMSFDQSTMFPEFLNGPEYAYWYNKGRMLNGKSPLFTNEQIDLMLNGDPDGKWGNTNWLDEVLQVGKTQHTSLSIDGGSESIKYYFMAGYYDQEGSVKSIDFNRYNFRANVDAMISKDFKISVGLGGRKQDKTAPTFSTEKNT